VQLKIPPEPILAKELIKRGLEAHRDLEIANLKQSTWIASPLWKDAEWGKELKKNGITWQKFMEIVRDHYPYFLDWVNDKASWDYVIKKLIERIEEEVKFSEKSRR
jgi:hypothetical protein